MTDQPKCPRCGHPIHDMAYICQYCGAKLAKALGTAALLAGEAAVTIAKLDRVNPGQGVETDIDPWEKNPGALYPNPLIVDLDAARQHDAAVGEMLTWARHVHEESGRPLPTVRTMPCEHESCAQRRRGEVHGPRCSGSLPAEHPSAVFMDWLSVQVDWLRHRPEAEEAYEALHRACIAIERIVDNPPEKVIVGSCPCGEVLYANRGKTDVKCTGCGTSYDVAAARDLIRRQLGESIFTASEIATLAAYLGISGTRENIRKRINQWHARGRLAAHDYLGQTAFRFDEVIGRLAEAG
jgi:hypothetical protein